MIKRIMNCDVCGAECNSSTLIRMDFKPIERIDKGEKSIWENDICGDCYRELLEKFRQMKIDHNEEYEKRGFKRERMIMFAGDVKYD